MEEAEKRPYKQKNLHWMDVLLGACTAVLMFLAKDKLGGVGSKYHASELAAYLFAAVILLLLFWVLLVVGRIAAQLLCGGELLFLRVDNRIYIQQEGRLVKKKTLSEDRFFSYTVRPKPVTNGRYPFLGEALGGLVPVLAGTLLFGFLVLSLHERKGFFLVACAFGFLAGAFTLLRELFPYRNPKRIKCGNLLFSGLFTPKTRELIFVFRQVDALRFDGVRLRDMPKEYFEECKGDKLTVEFAMRAKQLRADYEMDCGNFTTAQEILEELLAFARKRKLRTQEYSRDLIFLALLAADKPRAKANEDWYYRQAEQELKHLPEWARTKHARRLFEKHKDDGLGESFSAFEKKFQAYPFRGRLVSEFERVVLVDKAFRRSFPDEDSGSDSLSQT